MKSLSVGNSISPAGENLDIAAPVVSHIIRSTCGRTAVEHVDSNEPRTLDPIEHELKRQLQDLRRFVLAAGPDERDYKYLDHLRSTVSRLQYKINSLSIENGRIQKTIDKSLLKAMSRLDAPVISNPTIVDIEYYQNANIEMREKIEELSEEIKNKKINLNKIKIKNFQILRELSKSP